MDFKLIPLIFIISGLIYSVTNADEILPFRKDYRLIAEHNAYYKEHKTKVFWVDAVATCSAEGAELVVPNTKSEIDSIFEFIDKETTHFWVGIHDRFSEGEFVTLNGSSVHNVYTNWYAGEPNNAFGNENCVAVDTGHKTYNDLGCEHQIKFVCRRDARTLRKNRYCDTYDIDYFPSKVTEHCYKLHKTPATWGDAFKICRAELSELTILNSEAEAKVLVDMLKNYPADTLRGNFDKTQIHVGFNDLLKFGDFRTTDGKTLAESGYEKWSIGQPNYRNSEHCGSMFRDGTLNDVDCKNYAMYFCEKILD